MTVLIPVFIVFFIYALLIMFYSRAWKNNPLFNQPVPPSTMISVIVPARNEELAIGSLLDALKQQTYPGELFEVIVIDDHSEDRTAEIVRQYKDVRLVSLQADAINSFKKKAIETGIAAATGELIVATDADCRPNAGWLQTISAFRNSTGAVFIAAPVVIECNSSLLQMFQAIDFMILQGITGAVVQTKTLTMCNGANLAYDRSVFYEVGGFDGIDRIASGDDMLLMHKIWKKYPDRVLYLKSKEAMVSTQPQLSWRDFYQQRLRWASKAGQYDDKRFLPVLLVVYLLNLSFLILAIAGFWNNEYWMWMIGLWIAKTLVELPFVHSLATFFNKEWAVRWFLLFQPLHIVYTIISGLFSQVGKYEWKGRRVK
ncbi:MAG: glycosyltransferase [Chitinophagaceae bacterium]|nr:glycosyltransferase [Chitinophagaceae bacterium]